MAERSFHAGVRRHPVKTDNKEKDEALLHMWIPRNIGVAFQLRLPAMVRATCCRSVFTAGKDRRLLLAKVLVAMS